MLIQKCVILFVMYQLRIGEMCSTWFLNLCLFILRNFSERQRERGRILYTYSYPLQACQSRSRSSSELRPGPHAPFRDPPSTPAMTCYLQYTCEQETDIASRVRMELRAFVMGCEYPSAVLTTVPDTCF